MRVVNAEAPLDVAHAVPDDYVPAQPAAVGLWLPPRRNRFRTVCGLPAGGAWVPAERYDVPDCPDCYPDSPADEQDTLL